MRPPFPYFGGKMMLADRIVEVLPAHRHYVEPFAGSLSVLLAKPRSAHETVNDLEGDLMLFWRVLRERPAELAAVCALTPHSRAEHAAAYEREEGIDDLERARRVWVLLSQGRGGTFRRTGWRFYRSASNTCSAMPDYLAAYVDRIPPAARRLHGVSLECRPALEVIEEYGRAPSVLLYVDPPYLLSTRHRSANYKTEMGSEVAHRELADALADCAAAVVLSGYPSPLYDELYAGWYRVELDAFTGQNNTYGSRTEVLWSNRPLGEPSLFDDPTGE